MDFLIVFLFYLLDVNQAFLSACRAILLNNDDELITKKIKLILTNSSSSNVTGGGGTTAASAATSSENKGSQLQAVQGWKCLTLR